MISGWSALLWGGWVLVANWGHGPSAAVAAGLTQGLVSLTVTSVMTVTLELVSRACAGTLAKLLWPTAASVLLHALYTLTAHWLAGTPALVASVAPVIALGGVGFSLAYSAALLHISRPDARIPRLLLRLAGRVGPRPHAERGP